MAKGYPLQERNKKERSRDKINMRPVIHKDYGSWADPCGSMFMVVGAAAPTKNLKNSDYVQFFTIYAPTL